MGLKQDLQTIAYLKEKEEEQKQIDLQQQKELAELKKDIIKLIDIELMEINQNQVLLFYFDNKYELIDNIYNKLMTITKKIKKSSRYDELGNTSIIYEEAKKYQDYNRNNLTQFIDDILYDYIKKLNKEEKEKEKEELKQIDDVFFDVLNATYKDSKLSAKDFYNTGKKQELIDKVFNYCNIQQNQRTIKSYFKALREIKNMYQVQDIKQDKKTSRKGNYTLLAIGLGIWEGLANNKKRRR